MKRRIRLKVWGGIAAFLVICFFGVLCLKIPALGLDGEVFCGGCHVMQEQVDTYTHSAHRIHATCGDCHVPHHLVRGAFNKAWTGTVDLIGVVRNHDPYDIHASEDAKNIIHENCVRCHSGWLNQIGNTMDDGGRRCFDCHRNTPHGVKPNMTAEDMRYLDHNQGATEEAKAALAAFKAQAKGDEER